MFKINRKTIVIASMVLLLLVTGFLNWRYTQAKADEDLNNNNNITNPDDGVTTSSTFSDYRLERERTRTQEITYIDSIISNTNTDQETLAEAQLMKLELTDTMEKEMLLEGLLKAKGFEDVFVTLGDESINVVVKDAELNQSEVAQILELVQRETSASAQNVKIIPTT
ncbi:MAG: SpoIIIAH-like family protein [Christensenellaceae bacterium]|jgi:hypothetical protein|nr:SpoIIIAH-like family protein [Christensenellaceae bacterium]MBS6564762.1 SpoIIIAH-like family protein [Clostridiales bacterium]PWL99917.1 MAG: hypothetical protein DBY09_03640 [Selenomonadales bacterium]